VSDDTVVDSATAKAAAQRCDPFGGDDRTSRGNTRHLNRNGTAKARPPIEATANATTLFDGIAQICRQSSAAITNGV